MKNLRIEERYNGVFLVCDRGDVAQMVAGYASVQMSDAKALLAAYQQTHKEESR